ncbi:MAG: OsmC family protein [Ectothiorhodospiraceae bacterium]|nr:OsmC family protein [Ectothiorhodospiraceae bacterium]
MGSLRTKPKSYPALVAARAGGAGWTLRPASGATLLAGTESTASVQTPADLLMASLASCLAISLDMAAERMAVDPGAVELAVTAHIDGDLPRRFNRFEVTVAVPGIADRAVAAELLERAKRICTVSHTLNADIVLGVAA